MLVICQRLSSVVWLHCVDWEVLVFSPILNVNPIRNSLLLRKVGMRQNVWTNHVSVHV